MQDKFKLNQEVYWKVSESLYGNGLVKGVSARNKYNSDKTYIIEPTNFGPKSIELPNDIYPYTHVTVSERNVIDLKSLKT